MSNETAPPNENRATGEGASRARPPTGSESRPEPLRRPRVRLILAGSIVAVLGAAALAAVILLQEDDSPTKTKSLNFAEVVTADLVQQNSLNGTLGSIAHGTVNTRLDGTVTWIPEPGAVLKAGDVLFVISDEPTELELAQIQQQIASAELQLASAKASYENVVQEPSPAEILMAQASIFQARAALEDLIEGPSESALLSAQQSVISAESQLAQAEDAKDNLFEAAEAATAAAEAAVAAAETALESAERSADNSVGGLISSQAALLSAETNYCDDLWPDSDAIAFCDERRAPISASDQAILLEDTTTEDPLRASQAAQLLSANVSYKNALALKKAADEAVETAKADIQAAIDELEEAKTGPTAEEVSWADDAIASAQISLDLAKIALAELEDEPTADILQAKANLATAEAGLADLIAGASSSDRSLALASVENARANLDIALQQQGTLAPGPVPTVLFFGSFPSWRALSINSAPGPDIAQLEENLFALGYDPVGSMILDDVYDEATSAAVERWQKDLAAEEDGVIDLGEIEFLSGEVQITNHLVSEGSSVGPGSPVLEISQSNKVVRVDLPADQQGTLTAGDAVTVELPDFTEVPATVISVSQTATQAQGGPATFEVLIELDDPASAEGLDEAPVDVIVVSDSVEGVMAVPVSALVALLEGGYAVETDVGGGLIQPVAVEVGFFGSNNMVEITSAALQPGDQVVVP